MGHRASVVQIIALWMAPTTPAQPAAAFLMLKMRAAQWLLPADSSKAADLMSVVHFWVSEQHATLPH